MSCALRILIVQSVKRKVPLVCTEAYIGKNAITAYAVILTIPLLNVSAFIFFAFTLKESPMNSYSPLCVNLDPRNCPYLLTLTLAANNGFSFASIDHELATAL